MNKKKLLGRNSRFLKIGRILVYPLTAVVVLILLLAQIRPDESDEISPAPVRLLIADFSSDAENSDLAVLLKPVLDTTLQQSNRLMIFPERKIRRFLKQNYEDPPARVTRSVAEQICQNEGISMLLIPGIERLNGSLVISARILHVDENRTSFADTISVHNPEHIAAAIEELSGRIRRVLGEGAESGALPGHIFSPDTTLEALKLFSQSLSFYAYRNRQDVMKDLLELLEENPDMGVAHLYLGIQYFQLKQHSKALLCISKAKSLSGDMPLKYRFLIDGIYDILSRRYVKASDHFLSYTKAFPYDWQSHSLSAQCATALGNYSLAVDEYKKAIDLDDTQTESYLGLCMTFLYGSDSLEARKILDTASTLEPHNPDVAIALGLLELVDNNPRFAIQAFEDARLSPPYESLGAFLQAQAKIYEGKFKDALGILSDGIAEDRQSQETTAEVSKKLARAQVYLTTGNRGAAADESNGITGVSNDPVFMAQLGSIQAATGQMSSAEKTLAQIRTLDPDPFVQAIGNCLQGEILAAEGRLQEAIQSFLLAKEYTKLPSPSLARVLMDAKQWDSAAAEFKAIRERKAAMLFPFHKPWFMGTWVRALYDAGHFSMISGNPEEAKQYFRQYLWIMESADSDLDSLKNAEILLTGRPLKRINHNDGKQN